MTYSDPQPLEVKQDDLVAHVANGDPLIFPATGKQRIRAIGGPFDGETFPYRGGIMVEMSNPDQEKWGPTPRVAYVYDMRGTELVAAWPTDHPAVA